uniref:NADH-ubiquinone oxidoreductase chain 5 n=1 Tax=Nothoaspis amazoniensis TaxID=765744 RepID=A0A1P8LFX0_9ACAR|nr:NADH dehydrogenase subunit 5 [Nothoaspis amazoniensis]APW83516.1 NADH dehydrogenase subunit 5 [Nothoaspis amazoniensis]
MFLKWGILMLILSLAFFLFSIFELMSMKVILLEYYIMSYGNFEIKMFFLFDWMSMIFSSVVLVISGSVIIYSADYMIDEKFKTYFLYGVLLFVGSMILMILSPNLIMILLGWDGLGLVSYCLVVFYQNYKSDVAGMITIMSNRVGDIMILLSIVMLLNFGVLDFMLFSSMFWICGYMLVIAGMTKSAQIPFSAWLPAAMAAPTPVSSLVHSSTLVTAGVYILIRLKFMMMITNYSNFLMYFSVLTMMMAGFNAVLETDLKKIIALSTLSQLGLMMVILSIGKADLSFFHLLTHALFKAMLFLCAGFMIHTSLGSQDIRFMGGFYWMNPLIGVAFSLANMSLFGIPFLSGFYSKDLILEFIYMSSAGAVLLIGIVVSTITTSIYSFRVMFYSLWKGGVKMLNFNYHWSIYMEVPILLMGVFVLFCGSMLSWILILDCEVINLNFSDSILNLWIVFIGFWIFYVFFVWDDLGCFKSIKMFVGNMWFMSTFTGPIFSMNLNKGIYYYNCDNGWVEELGPQGLYKFNFEFSKFIQWVQLSSFSNIICFLLFFVIFIF